MMLEGLQEGRTRWTHYSIAYHFVWIPRFRRRVLTGEIQKAFKKILGDLCIKHGFKLLAAETDEDHVHVFVSAPPRYSPAMIANILKGATSRKLRLQFPKLLSKVKRNALWTQAYYVGTAGNVSVETIRRYISDCQGR
jgi:putative transposase